MGRRSRFGFSVPGRTESSPDNKVIEEKVPIVRIDGSIHTSNAEKLLGQSSPSFAIPSLSSTFRERAFGKHTTTQPRTPCSDYTRGLFTSSEDLAPPSCGGSLYPRHNSRASSHALGPEDFQRHTTTGESATESVTHKESSSTLQSYYDPQRAPLSISQQTSASAVRDMALRKGHLPVKASHTGSRTGLSGLDGASTSAEEPRRRTSRLDLSRLFPKSKKQAQQGLPFPSAYDHSSAQISSNSDYFTRGRNRLSKSLKSSESVDGQTRGSPQMPQSRSTDPSDNAKTNVRRPPKGVQHWFDALSSDEDDQDGDHEVRPKPVVMPVTFPKRKSSLGQVRVTGKPSPWETYQRNDIARRRMSPVSELSSAQLHHPSNDTPVSSLHTGTSGRTRESKIARIDLTCTSALSMSSSEDEGDGTPGYNQRGAPAVRESLIESGVEGDDVLISKAQMYEVTSSASRHPSTRSKTSRVSAMTTNSNAGTIQMIYAPVPPLPQLDQACSHHNRSHSRAHSRSHCRGLVQQSPATPEFALRPHTAEAEGLLYEATFASPTSNRTSKSEPKSREAREQHRLMAVTEEEEALLEMMRLKRAAMAEQSFSQGYKTALDLGRSTRPSSSETTSDDEERKSTRPRTSGFLTRASPEADLIDAFPTPNGSIRCEPTSSPSRQPLQTRNGRRKPSNINTSGHIGGSGSHYATRERQAISNDLLSWRESTIRNAYSRLTPSYSQADAPPSPSQTDSLKSATTASNLCPTPSPSTPDAEHDLHVRVAGSEPNTSGDDEAAIAPHSVVDFASPPASIKETLSEKSSQRTLNAQNRATGSMSSFELPLEHTIELTAIPRRTTSRLTNNSDPSRTPSCRSVLSGYRDSKSFRNSNRNSHTPSIAASINAHSSVSEDVLAAWGSLGGWRDYEATNRRTRA